MLIGYYAHHVGAGHVTRARSLLGTPDLTVTGLSSATAPAGWTGDWVLLERDDDVEPVEPTAGGALHWAPLGGPGLGARMARISRWLEEARPAAMVVDVSVEVALLCRLHGVPVVTLVLPGDRGDPAHRLVHTIASAVVAVWPAGVEGMVRGLDDVAVRRIGALSRFDDRPLRPTPAGRRQVCVLGGLGGSDWAPEALRDAAAQTPGWTWRCLLPGSPDWSEDPWPTLLDSHVVVTHAGQNALAEVAAARRPAVVVPCDRPHDEQRTTAAVLASSGLPAIVEPAWPATGWAARLERAAALDGADWSAWNDGDAAARLARVVAAVAR